jgi:hypothetical protein
MPDELSERFEERFSEILAYLDFLENVQTAVQSGVPQLGGEDGLVVTTLQQRILYSGVYLQLYNLVESTMTGCLDAVSKAAIQQAHWGPADLSTELRREWVKYVARTHVEMGSDKRLEKAILLCDHLVSALPVGPFDIEKGGGGNWDDGEIHRVALRIGFDLKVSKRSFKDVKKIVRDDLGSMALIVSLRNKLAHGSMSFAECGRFDTVNDLKQISKRVAAYLREVVEAFITYIKEHKYLRPEVRPQQEIPAN